MLRILKSQCSNLVLFETVVSFVCVTWFSGHSCCVNRLLNDLSYVFKVMQNTTRLLAYFVEYLLIVINLINF